jgi:hypothetical protein
MSKKFTLKSGEHILISIRKFRRLYYAEVCKNGKHYSGVGNYADEALKHLGENFYRERMGFL